MMATVISIMAMLMMAAVDSTTIKGSTMWKKMLNFIGAAPPIEVGVRGGPYRGWPETPLGAIRALCEVVLPPSNLPKAQWRGV